MKWPIRQLRDFITIRHGYPFSSRDFGRQGNYIVLTPGHFFETGGFQPQPDKERTLNTEPPREFVLSEGDLVVAMTEQAPGLLGSCAVIPKSERYLHNQRIGLITITQPKRLRADYLFHALNSPFVRKQIHRSAGGMKVRHTSPDKIGAAWFPCPPVDDQRAIANVLGSFDDVLKCVRRAARVKRALRRALLQEMMSGRRRFPQFSSRRWSWSQLGKCVKHVARRNRENIQLVLTASGQHGLVDQQLYFNRRVAGTDLRKYQLLLRGEFAYNRSAMSGYPFGATKRLEDYDAGALSSLYMCFSISSPCVDSDYLTYVFESGVLDRQLRRIARVGARAHGLLNVTDNDFLKLSIPLPEVDEQRHIAGLLKLADRELELLISHETQIAQQKSAVVHQLLPAT